MLELAELEEAGVEVDRGDKGEEPGRPTVVVLLD